MSVIDKNMYEEPAFDLYAGPMNRNHITALLFRLPGTRNQGKRNRRKDKQKPNNTYRLPAEE